MTLLVRDEADVVDAHLAYHLNAGVDFVVATDNGSVDGTTEMLCSSTLDLGPSSNSINDPVFHASGSTPWVTRMARLGFTEYGADWVINADADEFWWPRGGSLKDVLDTIPFRTASCADAWRHFLPRAEGDPDFFAERMTVRLCTPASPGDKETIFHAHQKVAHRATADVEIEGGNHNAPPGTRA